MGVASSTVISCACANVRRASRQEAAAPRCKPALRCRQQQLWTHEPGLDDRFFVVAVHLLELHVLFLAHLRRAALRNVLVPVRRRNALRSRASGAVGMPLLVFEVCSRACDQVRGLAWRCAWRRTGGCAAVGRAAGAVRASVLRRPSLSQLFEGRGASAGCVADSPHLVAPAGGGLVRHRLARARRSPSSPSRRGLGRRCAAQARGLGAGDVAPLPSPGTLGVARFCGACLCSSFHLHISRACLACV